MATRRELYESHKQTVTAQLEQHKKALAGKKLDEKAQKRDPIFRKLKADIKKFDLRIKALDKVDAVNADLVQRRAERAAQPKVKKEKKKKVAPAAAKPKKEKKAAPAG